MENTNQTQCRHLRTKTAYIPEADQPDAWRSGESSTAQYWCLCTMTTAGPDNQFAAPESCGHARSCFVSAELPM
ncbi:hypothetical protein JNM05_06680 [bacterium]|nr:hypothetical protein [bacterium]